MVSSGRKVLVAPQALKVSKDLRDPKDCVGLPVQLVLKDQKVTLALKGHKVLVEYYGQSLSLSPGKRNLILTIFS